MIKKLGVSEFNCRRIDSLIGESDVARRNEILSLLVQCIKRLPQLPKKVLAMYYYGEFQLDEIASALGLSEYEVDQIRAKALRELETMLAGRIGLERRARNCERLSASNGSCRSSTRLAGTAKPSHDERP